VIEARTLSDSLRAEATTTAHKPNDLDAIIQSLDAMGYDEAAQYVYGMHYDDWKKRHGKTASDETMQKFNHSKSLWAKHDKERLSKRTENPSEFRLGSGNDVVVSSPGTPTGRISSLRSNVCCQNADEQLQQPQPVTAPHAAATNQSRTLPPYQPPAPPPVSFSLGILTVSDRASKGDYETGDLSGPAVRLAVESTLKTFGDHVILESVSTDIVPDDIQAIQGKLREWADVSKIQLILTTGGTGFSPRDVTPEATNGIVDRVCDGLITFCTMECAKIQPLASLSRGSAGVRGGTFIANLPGNPKGVLEIVPILLPLALQGVKDLC
jgi:molybdopterin adenylyltransferase